MRFLPALIFMLHCLSPATAGAQELRLNRGIMATASYPAGEGPFPALLMLHGLGSSRDEAGNLFADAAEALAEAGYASLRIDFRGFGQSPGDTGAFTLTRQLEDAQIALQALAGLKDIDAARIGVIGFSFGAGAAIELAAAEPGRVKALALWAPVGDYHQDLLESFGPLVFERAQSDGIAAVDLGWRSLAFRKAFFDGLRGPDLPALLQGFGGSVLLVNGAQDPYLRYAPAYSAPAAGQRHQLILEGADHLFNAYKAGSSRVPEVIAASRDHFDRAFGLAPPAPVSPSPQNSASP